MLPPCRIRAPRAAAGVQLAPRLARLATQCQLNSGPAQRTWHHTFDGDGGYPLLSFQGFTGPPLRRPPPPRLPLLLQALHLSGLPPLHNIEEEGQPQGNDTEQHDASNEHGCRPRGSGSLMWEGWGGSGAVGRQQTQGRRRWAGPACKLYGDRLTQSTHSCPSLAGSGGSIVQGREKGTAPSRSAGPRRPATVPTSKRVRWVAQTPIGAQNARWGLQARPWESCRSPCLRILGARAVQILNASPI